MSTDWMSRTIADVDPDVAAALEKERLRQNNNLEMIASENFVSKAVMAAAGSIFTNKYAEGYPGRRYYGGCEQYDIVENLARDRAKQLFGAEHANVQPHSGAQANMAVLMAMVKPGETILGMDLSHGGHLTHGHPLNYSGKTFKVVSYGVTKEAETLDYDALAALAAEHKPRMIICGASAYPRIIDFERIGQIARDNEALCLADIAHIAGLVVAGLHPSPVPHVDFVTTTTHKTLRGPRGGLILCRESAAKEIGRALFPGVQGGPLMHGVAAKAVAFREALELQFGEYQKQVLRNASALAEALIGHGWRLVSGGTDNHLVLVDVFSKGVTGKVAERALERASITVNKNTIPFDTQPPLVASGVRLGTPALTTRGMVEEDMQVIAGFIDRVLTAPEDEAVASSVRADVEALCSRFPLYL